jgi:hypothetical protein
MASARPAALAFATWRDCERLPYVRALLNPIDRELDGFHGPVHSVTVEIADLTVSLGRWAESERRPDERLVYDERGNRVAWVFYDDAGEIAKRYDCEFDGQNRRTRSVVTGPNGAPIEEVAYAYGEDGLLATDTITDARRQGALYVHERRSNGRRTVERRRRADGIPGRSETTIYDGSGRAVGRAVYAADGHLDHRWVYRYDRAGRRTSEISYFADGSFRSKELCKYNERGDEYKIAVFRPDGSLSMKWAYAYLYDAKGNWTRRTGHIKTRSLGTARYRAADVVYRTIEYYE